MGGQGICAVLLVNLLIIYAADLNEPDGDAGYNAALEYQDGNPQNAGNNQHEVYLNDEYQPHEGGQHANSEQHAPDSSSGHAASFSYGQGAGIDPGHWSALVNATVCSYFHPADQSPIDIIPELVVNDLSLRQIHVHSRNLTGGVLNTGRTYEIEFSPAEQQKTRLVGGPLSPNRVFRIAQMHFHWGGPGQPGSEHWINHAQYDAELHIVHYDSLYSNFSNAITKTNGVAVLSVLLSKNVTESPEMQRIIKPAAYVSTSKQVPILNNIDINALLPSDHHYWTYEGSLTTPTCAELTTWIVISTPVGISSESLRALNGLKDPDGYSIGPNFRPVQSRNQRHVRRLVFSHLHSQTIYLNDTHHIFDVPYLYDYNSVDYQDVPLNNDNAHNNSASLRCKWLISFVLLVILYITHVPLKMQLT